MAGQEIWALVPVKRLSQAKQRLKSVLSPGERRSLARAMLCDVLETLRATPSLAGIVVVSADPDVHAMARSFGTSLIFDASESGINDAVGRGLDALASNGHGALVVPADIPFATPNDFETVIALLQRYQAVISPALSDGGTNALAMRSADLIKPHFGENSFSAHCALAGRTRLSFGVSRSKGIGWDIDVAADLEPPDFVGADLSNLTASLLREFERDEVRLMSHDVSVAERIS